MGKRKFRKKKEKRTCVQKIKDGNLIFDIVKTPEGLYCPCHKFYNKENDHMCPHILKLIKKKCVEDYIINLYDVFRSFISDHFNKKNLSEILKEKYDEIMSHDCAFCHDELYKNVKNEGWHICEGCKNLLHARCFRLWDIKNKGCMFCKYQKKTEMDENYDHIFPTIEEKKD